MSPGAELMIRVVFDTAYRLRTDPAPLLAAPLSRLAMFVEHGIRIQDETEPDFDGA